jgi:NCS1 family nucleobase:cation symporter-1
MSVEEHPGRIEIPTIQPIPRNARHGTARDLFTIWFGSNIMLLTVVTGGLAVTVFGLSFAWAVVGLTVGNMAGGVFMALHAAQGPTLGVPQMVQTRGQFGSIGSLLIVGIVIVMYVGFVASNLVLSGEALASLAPGLTATPGIVFVSALGVMAAIYGYALIHAYTRWMSLVSGLVLALAFAWVIGIHGLPADFLMRNGFSWPGFIDTVSVAALWQIAYAPYVSDYTRYMPVDTGVKPAFWASFWGCVLGSLLPMILGAIVGIAATGTGLVHGLTMLLGAIAPLVLIVFSIGIAAASAMNLYCGALSSLTFGQTLLPRWSPGPGARTVIVLILGALSTGVAMLGRAEFLTNYEHFILFLLYVLVPWTAINLVDYYLLRHGVYDVESFFRRDGGIYGRVNGAAIFCYVLGIAVQLPFVASAMYTGAAARAMGGIDLSWIVGLTVTSPVYYFLARGRRLT